MRHTSGSPLVKDWYRAVAVAAILVAAVAGCETGTTHKTQLDANMSDVTTTPPATAHADAPGTQAQGQAPVPGSPTASNADGTQPPDDAEARNSSSAHRETDSGKVKP